MTEHNEYDRPDPPVLATRIVVMRDSDDSILWIAYNADGSTHGYGPVDLGDRLEERVLRIAGEYGVSFDADRMAIEVTV
jgi:hypothetical protein